MLVFRESRRNTQGYIESLPEPNLRLEKEVEQSKKKVVDLKGQVEEVKQTLAEAKAQLKERAENQKVVNAAKATAAELAVRPPSGTRGGGRDSIYANTECYMFTGKWTAVFWVKYTSAM